MGFKFLVYYRLKSICFCSNDFFLFGSNRSEEISINFVQLKLSWSLSQPCVCVCAPVVNHISPSFGVSILFINNNFPPTLAYVCDLVRKLVFAYDSGPGCFTYVLRQFYLFRSFVGAQHIVNTKYYQKHRTVSVLCRLCPCLHLSPPLSNQIKT